MLDLNTRVLTVLTETKDALVRLREGRRDGATMGECSAVLDKVSALIDLLDDRHNSTFKMDGHEVLEHVIASHPGLVLDREDLEINGGDLVEDLSLRLKQMHAQDLDELVEWAKEHAPEEESEHA